MPSNAASGARAQDQRAGLVPARLRCETFRDPLGIDARQPRLSWQMQPVTLEARGLRQRAYQIQVASDPALFETRPDLWDSAFVESAEQLEIEYAGAPLTSRTRCFWRVRIWDEAGAPSEWSPAARWDMGLLEPTDWSAIWIGDGRSAPTNRREYYAERPAPLLRRAFSIDRPVARATLYAAGLGYYEMRLNGDKVSDHVLDPAWTSFDRRVSYTTHDVTGMLGEGDNVLGAMLGNGWFDPLPLQMWGRIDIREHLLTGAPRLLAQLEIELEGGERVTIGTDDSWTSHAGPIRRNSVYLGEEYDARHEQPGWDAPGFDDSTWTDAVPVDDAAGRSLGRLEAQSVPPIRATDRLRPVDVKQISPGVFIFDLGRNFAGWARLRVQGPRGTRVKMRFGELLHPDGRLNPMTSVAGQIKGYKNDGSSIGGAGSPAVAEQIDTYTLKGEGVETYTPRFTFHGFRYVEVTGFPGTPDLDAIEGIRLNTDVETIGSFWCSDHTLNSIQEMVQWTLLSNLFSVQSDCPAREKFQYGGDIVATSETATLNFDFASVYAKTVRDHADGVQGDGWLPETAPYVGISAASYAEGAGPIGWGLAHPLLLVQLHRYYGNRRLIQEQYPVARRWVDLYAEHADGHILDRCISDHESIDPKPVELTATAHYHQAARLVARMATILGREDDAARYAWLAEDIGAAFTRRFLVPGTGQFHRGTQACQATALTMGLVPEGERAAAVARMVDQVVDTHRGHVATGIFGTKYLLEQLTRNGHVEVAFDMVTTRDFPGWGYMLERGATTLWEHWEYSDDTYSHNHPMFGSVSEWLIAGIGGIRPHEEAVGFDRFYVEPHPVAGLSSVQTTVRAVRGRIDSHWYREGNHLIMAVLVPPNSLAQVRVPTDDPDAVTEGSMPAGEAPGVRALSPTAGRARFLVGSGSYEFVAPWTPAPR